MLLKQWKLLTIGLIQNHLKTTNSNQKPNMTNYSSKQLMGACRIYGLEAPPINTQNKI